jgi:hypothetical protein
MTQLGSTHRARHDDLEFLVEERDLHVRLSADNGPGVGFHLPGDEL